MPLHLIGQGSRSGIMTQIQRTDISYAKPPSNCGEANQILDILALGPTSVYKALT